MDGITALTKVRAQERRQHETRCAGGGKSLAGATHTLLDGCCRLPVVMVSGNSGAEDTAKYTSAGADAVLAKGGKKDALLDALEQLRVSGVAFPVVW